MARASQQLLAQTGTDTLDVVTKLDDRLLPERGDRSVPLPSDVPCVGLRLRADAICLGLRLGPQPLAQRVGVLEGLPFHLGYRLLAGLKDRHDLLTGLLRDGWTLRPPLGDTRGQVPLELIPARLLDSAPLEGPLLVPGVSVVLPPRPSNHARLALNQLFILVPPSTHSHDDSLLSLRFQRK